MIEKTKKQLPLRLSAKLYQEIYSWAEDDFRSVNGQIEYLLANCVKAHKQTQKRPSKHQEKIFVEKTEQ